MGRDEMAGACHLSLKSGVSNSESRSMNHSRGDLLPAEVSQEGPQALAGRGHTWSSWATF